ncbi:MAG: hypothetical protein CVU51_10255 [Deltaproteobacteria bacterium HGW-Deltaproteobacteria-1]|jgi:putative component of toxin-antitoxin plasmid stabilization module|nr:MAG: hypothetical protein CVU51_10255 [Deltaproteobacteria bacterium HGW-Deltaproteobacteria-1]
MSRKKIITGAVLVILAVAAAIFVFYPKENDPAGSSLLSGPSTARNSAVTSPSGAIPESDPFSDKIVSELKKYYGSTIAKKSTQAEIISIRDFVMGLRPEKGKDYFYSILKRAFPEYADEIMKTMEKLDLYNRWLSDNRDQLMKMTASERLAAMWNKRKELFGEDAEKIWSGELLATEERKAKMQDTLAGLNKSREMSLDAKLGEYKRVLKETYTGTAEEFILNQGGLLSKVFFSLDSVQEELNNLSPAQRQQEINRLRSEMGMTERQVESMARRDADNASRWDTGLQYMEKREAVVKQYEGQELENRLKDLRKAHFGDEANTIALEEKDGFYRFKRPHIWGRN